MERAFGPNRSSRSAASPDDSPSLLVPSRDIASSGDRRAASATSNSPNEALAAKTMKTASLEEHNAARAIGPCPTSSVHSIGRRRHGAITQGRQHPSSTVRHCPRSALGALSTGPLPGALRRPLGAVSGGSTHHSGWLRRGTLADDDLCL